VILSGLLALSARGAPELIVFHLTTTAKTTPHIAAAEKITRQSHLARHSRCDASSNGPLSYHYPVKPFARQHPIRGYYGDPRTPTGKHTAFAPGARGPFNFHKGVDIVAADGSPVYPVVSGVVVAVNPDNVVISTNDDRWFQYYHIWPSVQSRQYVVAYKTVLGHVQAPHRHVHLTEGDGISSHNPLDPGHLEPYQDKTIPVVDGVHFSDDHGRRADALDLRSIVHIAADVHDMPALPLVGTWPGLGITAAVVAWKIQAPNGSVVIPSRSVADFRQAKPRDEDFWNTFALGTHQNKFGSKKLQQVTLVGRYSYDLTPSGLDTRSLPDGAYILTVRATDTCGNNGSLSAKIKIANEKVAARQSSGSAYAPAVST
jgi:hypothetical protein